MRRSLGLAVVLLLTPLFVTNAAGQATGAEAHADEMVERAIDLREAGREVEALELLERAFRTFPAPRTEAQLGFAYQAVGRWADAEQHLSSALASDDPWVDERRPIIVEARNGVREHLVALEITVDQPGADVSIEGRSVGRSPLAAAVWREPGSVEVRVDLPGFFPRTERVELHLGETARLAVELQSAAPRDVAQNDVDSTPPPHDDEDDEGSPRVFTWVALGGAALFAGGAAVSWALANGEYDDLQACRPCSDAQIDDSSVEEWITATNVFLVGAGVAATTAVVLFFVEGDASPAERRAARPMIRF